MNTPLKAVDYSGVPLPSGMVGWAVTGAQINSALYLIFVFVSAHLTGNTWSWRLVTAAAGATYLSYIAQCSEALQRASGARALARIANIAAISLAAIGGLLLLF